MKKLFMLGIALALLVPESIIAVEKEKKSEDIELPAAASMRMILFLAPVMTMRVAKKHHKIDIFYRYSYEMIDALKTLVKENKKYEKSGFYQLLVALDKENLSSSDILKQSSAKNIQKDGIRRLQLAIWLKIYKIIGSVVTVSQETKKYKALAKTITKNVYAVAADDKINARKEEWNKEFYFLLQALQQLNQKISSKATGKSSLAYVNLMLAEFIAGFYSNSFVDMLLIRPPYLEEKKYNAFKSLVNAVGLESVEETREDRKIEESLDAIEAQLERLSKKGDFVSEYGS